MKSAHRIILRSDLYGEEEFHYDTRKEQREGTRRLLQDCRREFKKDRVPREIIVADTTVHVGKENEDE